MKRTLIFLLFVIGQLAYAQDPDCYAKKKFLIIASSRDYNSALMTATKAEKELGYILNLRGLEPSNDIPGLTLPADSCRKIFEEYGITDTTCYYARGKWDDGVYISIEYSNAYSSFAKGYYVVMLASGFADDEEVSDALNKTKGIFKDAYIKQSDVYMCCSH